MELRGGYGQGKPKKIMHNGEQRSGPSEGEGAGGGGGIYAKAKGVFEITPANTRFIPASGNRQILIGIGLGILLKTLIFGNRHDPPKG